MDAVKWERTYWRWCVGLVLICLGTGCCSFERQWRQAAGHCYPSDPLAGRWEGTWESCVNGHTGSLRAIITPCNGGHYHVHFHATFAGCIPYAYEVAMHSVREGDLHRFHGSADLGCLAGGVYQYEGEVNGDCYRARYQARKDNGIFTMRRVQDSTCCEQGRCAAQ